MKNIILLFTLVLFLGSNVYSQISVDEIIDGYFEVTGGKANWEKLEGIKLEGISNTQGMEIPIEVVQLKSGKQYVKISLQGKEMMQGVYNGDVLWSTNFMTQKAEKMPTELADNFKKNEAKDFPSPFLNYKEKGYNLEFIGEETVEGAECYKVKLTQNPIMVDGKEEEKVSFHFFEKESSILLVSEIEMTEGPMKGQMMKSTMSDYDEVDGLYFPFSLSQMGMPFNIKKIVLNPEVDDSIFEMPEEEETPPPTEEKK